MTEPVQKKAPKTLKKKDLDEDVWTLAVQRARQLYDMFDHVAVQFSGGKDSTATLHAVLAAAHEKPEERLPLRVVFWDEEIVSKETEDYVRRISQRDDVALEWYCIPIKHRNAASSKQPYWAPWAPEDKHKWVRPLPPEAITDLPGGYAGLHDPEKRLHHSDLSPLIFDPAIHGEACEALGIRAAESLRRYGAVSKREKDNWIIRNTLKAVRGALWKAYPVYDWSTQDVWTAPKLLGWDYNHNYDLQEMHGLTSHSQRVGPPFGNEALQKLNMWPVLFPDLWEKMIERVPGVATAARYATTELYAWGEYPEKPDGITWPQFIKQILDKLDPEARRDNAEAITNHINTHKRASGNELIPEKAWHPESGASWDYLAMLAQRGDMMGRRAPSNRIVSQEKTKEYARTVQKYNDDLARVREEGRMKEII